MPQDITRIEPNDPRHRQVIRAALKAKDTDALSALRGNTHKPIKLIKNWFLYGLMISSYPHDELNHVPIYFPQTRLDMAKAMASIEGKTVVATSPIPLDTYDFL